MVFVMMILERFGRHIRLERVIGIRKLHKVEGHGISPEVSREKVAGKLKVP
jgi:hypothetical protein